MSDTRGFILLESGPLGRDELRGDADLIEAHNLTNIANHVISGRLHPGDYVKGIAGMGEFRKGQGLELAPVAEMHPAAIRPDLQPLQPDILQRGFMLQPGRYQLSEEDGFVTRLIKFIRTGTLGDKGTPVASALSQAGTASTTTAASVETSRKKEKKEKKEKKRKREGSKEAAPGPS